jgi:hypothetical protein
MSGGVRVGQERGIGDLARPAEERAGSEHLLNPQAGRQAKRPIIMPIFQSLALSLPLLLPFFSPWHSPLSLYLSYRAKFPIHKGGQPAKGRTREPWEVRIYHAFMFFSKPSGGSPLMAEFNLERRLCEGPGPLSSTCNSRIIKRLPSERDAQEKVNY